MRSYLFFAVAMGIGCAALTPAAAQEKHQDHRASHSTHHAGGHDAGSGPQPVMPGQDLFGALTEIVGILNDDPATDWTKVNIDALRAHLLDMHLVATESRPRADKIAGGLRFTLDSAGPVGAAAERMLAAHGPILEATYGWQAVLETGNREIHWSVRAPNGDWDVSRIRAMGFFGLLASGAHHQSHHLAISSGMGHPHATAE